MRIRVNGTLREVPEATTLTSLFEELKLNPSTTIVELNRSVLPKDSYGAVVLKEGDSLELVRIVGGG